MTTSSYTYFYVLGVFSAYILALGALLLAISGCIYLYERKSGRSIVFLFVPEEEVVNHAEEE